MDGLDLENTKIGLIFKNTEAVIMGVYDDTGEMGEASMSVISDYEAIYKNLPLDKFAVVVVRWSGEKVEMKDLFTYKIEMEKNDTIIDIYHRNPEEFFELIKDLYGNIISDSWH